MVTLTATLTRLGYKSHVATGRNRRPGYGARFMSGHGVKPGLVIFDYCAPGEFALICAALAGEGYRLEDAQGGINFVTYGCARVTPPASVEEVK